MGSFLSGILASVAKKLLTSLSSWAVNKFRTQKGRNAIQKKTQADADVVNKIVKEIDELEANGADQSLIDLKEKELRDAVIRSNTDFINL